MINNIRLESREMIRVYDYNNQFELCVLKTQNPQFYKYINLHLDTNKANINIKIKSSLFHEFIKTSDLVK